MGKPEVSFGYCCQREPENLGRHKKGRAARHPQLEARGSRSSIPPLRTELGGDSTVILGHLETELLAAGLGFAQGTEVLVETCDDCYAPVGAGGKRALVLRTDSLQRGFGGLFF